MRSLGLLNMSLCFTLCAGLASADTLQLRSGRRLEGKYIGGTSTAIGFISGASVEYFATTDVLVIMFDSAADSALDGSQRPTPMSGKVSVGRPRVAVTDTLNQSARDRNDESSGRSVSIREGHLSRARGEKGGLTPANQSRHRSFTWEKGGWPSLL